MAKPIITGRRLPNGGLTDIIIEDRARLTASNYRTVLSRLYNTPYHEVLTDGAETADGGFSGAYVCYYCGTPTSGTDHAPPLYLVWRKIVDGDTLQDLQLVAVPSCTSCNSRLGRKPILTLAARMQYLARQGKAWDRDAYMAQDAVSARLERLLMGAEDRLRNPRH